ncbi:MAG: dephospho-CoA kinase [Bryobacteraceae bacterium]|nr:dephospho-CoA kinase [Bryobacterales bacterium]MEB2361707.1 dephospho-CoA kinase [Bryobacterales bacterium]NUN02639.1 dephospho-CoA kinase [Bryobacteraceae bacterium]
MLRVGLTGGLASGKTNVGQALESMGCYLIQADRLGRKVLEPGGPAYASVLKEFGAGILEEDGSINRRELAAQVFANPDRLAVLNSLVHPHVIELEGKLLAEYERREPHGIGVVEAAILIETGSFRRFDKLILVMCSQEQQLERAMKRDGLSYEEVQARLERQMPLEEKRQYADYVIDTSGSKEETLAQTREVYNSLRSLIQK